MKKDRIDIEQDILEAFQAANQNKQEDMFVALLEQLPFSSVESIHRKYVKSETVQTEQK